MNKIRMGESVVRTLSLGGLCGIGLTKEDQEANICRKFFMIVDSRREVTRELCDLRKYSALFGYSARSGSDMETAVQKMVDIDLTLSYLLISDPLPKSRTDSNESCVRDLIQLTQKHWPVHTILLSDKKMYLDSIDVQLPYNSSPKEIARGLVQYAGETPSSCLRRQS